MKELKTNTGKSISGKRLRPRGLWKLEPQDMEKRKGESLTIQDESFTIRELLVKHVQGIPVGTYREPINSEGEADFDDDDFQATSRLDIHEKELLAKKVANKQNHLKEQIEQATKPKDEPKEAPTKPVNEGKE